MLSLPKRALSLFLALTVLLSGSVTALAGGGSDELAAAALQPDQAVSQTLSLNAKSAILLEQTTGLALLKAQAISAEIKTVLAMVFVCFGGLSILAQTYSIIHPQGLSVKKYIFGKIISGTAAGLLTLGWLYIARMFH